MWAWATNGAWRIGTRRCLGGERGGEVKRQQEDAAETLRIACRSLCNCARPSIWMAWGCGPLLCLLFYLDRCRAAIKVGCRVLHKKWAHPRGVLAPLAERQGKGSSTLPLTYGSLGYGGSSRLASLNNSDRATCAEVGQLGFPP